MISTNTPLPGGKYKTAVKTSELIYTSGMTPKVDGKLILKGKVSAQKPIELYEEAVKQAVSNCYVAATNALSEGEKITKAVQMVFMVNAEPDYLDHSKLADIATDFLYEKLGEDGYPARAAIGMGTLPGDAPFEIQMIFAYEK